MIVPELNLYGKFGDPKKLVEFRLFSFNSCSAGCKNCFYRKTDNNFSDFQKADKLAAELMDKDYSLETVYLLPTDVFETDFNFRIFKDQNLKNVLNKFRYIGFASTLKDGFDRSFLDSLFQEYAHLKIEMHVNLLEEKIFDEVYVEKLSATIRELRIFTETKFLLTWRSTRGHDLTQQSFRESPNWSRSYQTIRFWNLILLIYLTLEFP